MSVIGIPWPLDSMPSVGREMAYEHLGDKSFMNYLNESVGNKKWSFGFYYFIILLLAIMNYDNISNNLHIICIIQPVCSEME